MEVKKFNQEVLYCGEKIVKVKRRDIDFLKRAADKNERKRIRLCAHKNINDKQHEMLIVHRKAAYVRPHKHINKDESLHVIEGDAYLVFFTPRGKIKEVVRVSEYGNKNIFYCRISEGIYHNLIIISDWLIFHETTKGPFKRGDTVFAAWAPEETDIEARRQYMAKLFPDIIASSRRLL